jgi:hypothetical protein
MASNVFVSFDHDDQRQVGGFKLLKNNPNHPLEFQDHSLKDAVRERSGKPIKYPPSNPRSKPVLDAILAKFDCASKLVVLIGDDTHASAWVDWEIILYAQTAALEGEHLEANSRYESETVVIPSGWHGTRRPWISGLTLPCKHVIRPRLRRRLPEPL